VVPVIAIGHPASQAETNGMLCGVLIQATVPGKTNTNAWIEDTE
jgi:hypothetical protein